MAQREVEEVAVDHEDGVGSEVVVEEVVEEVSRTPHLHEGGTVMIWGHILLQFLHHVTWNRGWDIWLLAEQPYNR